MRIAIVYPLLFVAAQYLVTGEAVTMAGYPLVPAGTSYGSTLAVFGLVVAALAARVLASAKLKRDYEELSSWLIMAAGAFAGAFAFAFEVAFAGAFALALALALAGAFAVAFAVAVAVAFALALVGALAATASGALAATLAVYLCCRRGHLPGQLAYLLLHAVAFIGALMAAILIPKDDAAAIYIIAFALLPIVNALFDWLSYGVTILLLRTGHRRGGPWRLVFGALDLFVAALLFFALSFALIGTLVLVDSYREVPLFDLPAMLTDIQNGNLGEHAWVLAMVASTLLPTLVHLAIGFFSIMTLIRGSVWNALAARMTMDTTMGPQLAASFAFMSLRLGFLVVPMVLLGGVVYLLWLCGGTIAAHYATGLLKVTSQLGWFSS